MLCSIEFLCMIFVSLRSDTVITHMRASNTGTKAYAKPPCLGFRT